MTVCELDLSGLRYWQVKGSNECGHETVDAANCPEFLD